MPRSFQLMIMRLMQDQFLIGITGVILNDRHEILLLRHSYRQTEWSLPGGYIHAKEHPKEGLEREILEETGLLVSADRILSVRTDRATARLDISLMGKYCGGEFRPSAEVVESGFFAFENLPLISTNQLLLIKETLALLQPKSVIPVVPLSEPAPRLLNWFRKSL